MILVNSNCDYKIWGLNCRYSMELLSCGPRFAPHLIILVGCLAFAASALDLPFTEAGLVLASSQIANGYLAHHWLLSRGLV